MIQDALNQLLVLGAVGARTSGRYQINQQNKALDTQKANQEKILKNVEGTGGRDTALYEEAVRNYAETTKQIAFNKPSEENLGTAYEAEGDVYSLNQAQDKFNKALQTSRAKRMAEQEALAEQKMKQEQLSAQKKALSDRLIQVQEYPVRDRKIIGGV